MKQPVSAALYMRLSNEDDKYGESNSIETQRKILRGYAEENHIPVYDEYVDDGWSGTNFDRPNFKRMMEDVGVGKVNCVIVKDLSRFGRNYVTVGLYLESEFVKRGVRFISVNENEDTQNGLSDFVGLSRCSMIIMPKIPAEKSKRHLRQNILRGKQC